jgi:transcriptional regulator with XRE-family HTH domain
MDHTAGERIRAIRDLTNLTRKEFAQKLNLDFLRLRSIEQGKIRAAEDEFEKVGSAFPAMIYWLTYEGEIILEDLHNSPNDLERVISAKIEADLLPNDLNLKEKIVYEA